MPQITTARRLICPQCLRPQRTCICHWIARIENEPEVVILQHPLEVDNAKGSARLLHLSLPRSRLVIGESFAEQELLALLHAPFDKNAIDARHRQTMLLYPDSPADRALHVDAASMQQEVMEREPKQLRLIVLDATWRKSRKMLYLNPLLQRLPRLALRDAPASQYRIRKAHRPDQLSTLEATCYALMQLEQCTAEKYAPLFSAFDGFVAQQLAYRPAAD